MVVTETKRRAIRTNTNNEQLLIALIKTALFSGCFTPSSSFEAFYRACVAKLQRSTRRMISKRVILRRNSSRLRIDRARSFIRSAKFPESYVEVLKLPNELLPFHCVTLPVLGRFRIVPFFIVYLSVNDQSARKEFDVLFIRFTFDGERWIRGSWITSTSSRGKNSGVSSVCIVIRKFLVESPIRAVLDNSSLKSSIVTTTFDDESN